MQGVAFDFDCTESACKIKTLCLIAVTVYLTITFACRSVVELTCANLIGTAHWNGCPYQLCLLDLDPIDNRSFIQALVISTAPTRKFQCIARVVFMR